MQNKTPANHSPITFSLLCERFSGIRAEGKGGGLSEPFAPLDYARELAFKDQSFARYCELNHLLVPEKIIASPRSRGYRTTTKRKIAGSVKPICLVSDTASVNGKSFLEPLEHEKIYQSVEAHLNESKNIFLRPKINFVIIRGSYDEFSLIFNVNFLNAQIVRALDRIAAGVKDSCGIASAFIFNDPAKSRFYFESTFPEGAGLRLKKLFGHRNLRIKVSDIIYHFHPTSFSQVNLSAAELMLEQGKNIFAGEHGRLIDLYCGYGLFSCFIGRNFQEVIGIDYARDSILSAVENSRHLESFPPSRFYAAKVDPLSLNKYLPTAKTDESVILDPPRKGSAPGVIEALAHRGVDRVLHIFCGVDEIPKELSLWRKCGYRTQRIIPVDMFPGTFSLEVMVHLEKEETKGSRRYPVKNKREGSQPRS